MIFSKVVIIMNPYFIIAARAARKIKERDQLEQKVASTRSDNNTEKKQQSGPPSVKRKRAQ
jgi:hypothetical protein